MFNWYRYWKRNRAKTLFHYHDGSRIRSGDPFLIWRKLANHPTCNIENCLPLADRGEEPETSQLLGAIRTAFDVAAWNEATKTGLTDWETMNLLGQLNAYLESLKKNTSPLPISGEPTAAAPSNSSGVGPEPPANAMNSPSDFGRTPNEPRPENAPNI